MNYTEIIKQQGLIDIISVDDTHYAIVPERQHPILGFICIPATQLHAHLREFLARGFSQRYGKPYAHLVGLMSWTLFTYTLESLPPTRKQVFSHALMGAGPRPGLLSQWGGTKIGRSAFLVPLERERDALAFLSHWGVDYTREVISRG